MNSFDRRPAYLHYPSGIGLAGGLAVLAAGGWNWLGALLAMALGAAGIFAGRRVAAAQSELRRAIKAYVAGQREFGDAAAGDLDRTQRRDWADQQQVLDR